VKEPSKEHSDRQKGSVWTWKPTVLLEGGRGNKGKSWSNKGPEKCLLNLVTRRLARTLVEWIQQKADYSI
jgi:hypothetical protein